jgi:hypothetical protein
MRVSYDATSGCRGDVSRSGGPGHGKLLLVQPQLPHHASFVVVCDNSGTDSDHEQERDHNDKATLTT